MKKSELRNIIREEIRIINSLKEYTDYKFKKTNIKQIDKKVFSKLMPKTFKTSIDAEKRIDGIIGEVVNVHVQYHEVIDNANQKYLLYQRQYSSNLPSKEINVTELTVELFDNDDNHYHSIGTIFVDTNQFLQEIKNVFIILKYKY